MDFADLVPTVTRSRIAIFAALIFAGSVGYAEEGGSGHYFQGSMSSFVDGAPSAPTFITRFNYAVYDGQVDINREIPIAGLLAGNVDASSTAIGLTVLWAPDWNLGEKWQYSMAVTIPWVDLKVAADVRDPISGPTISRGDRVKALGDIVFIPAMFNYNVNPDFNINMRVTFYVPTGDYEVGRLANTGKNFLTIEPTVGFMYLGQKNGREASLFFGADFNQKNDDTDYQSGTQIHFDGTLAQHLPLWGGLAGIGLSGYWYRQVTGDSGSGANFGDFKAQANGLGPVLSFASNAGGNDVIAELKWLKEFGNENRLEGDTLWFKILGKF